MADRDVMNISALWDEIDSLKAKNADLEARLAAIEKPSQVAPEAK